MVSQENVRILMIEDSQSDFILFKKSLDASSPNAPFDITQVPSLAKSYELLKNNHFDFVILDLNILDMQGIGSVAALRAVIPHIPIVVHSGIDSPDIIERTLLLGADHYLIKGKSKGGLIEFLLLNARQKKFQKKISMY